MDASGAQRHRQRLLALKAEILATGDIEPEAAREDETAVGNDEDAQPLAEMSQAIASSRNRNRAGVLARVLAGWPASTPIRRASATAPSVTNRSPPSGSS